ncbi:MAG: dockerin type I domain-containing protein, partial [Dehalococcoidia bacterium]|nr:dockerin type I domain-containing protein [Dehalococcoidia bacterium]
TITVTVDGITDWQNHDNPMDANRDGFVTPFDVLVIINTLNRDGSRALDTIVGHPQYWYDVMTSSPKTVPVAVKESIRAAGPERIFLDATETTFSGPDYREAA